MKPPKPRCSPTTPTIVVLMIALVTLSGLCVAACSPTSEDTRHFRVGLVTNNRNGLKNVQGFKDGMTALGYLEGNNITYIFAGAPVQGQVLETILSNFEQTKVDLIFTAGTPTGIAAYRLTKGTDIPVVFGVIADPIAAGVMQNLTRPGGNMTGVRLSPNQARRLQFLLEIVPTAKHVFVPYNPQDAASGSAVAQVEKIAQALGVDIIEGIGRNNRQVDALLTRLASEDLDAIFLVPGTTVNARLQDILAVAQQRRLPVSSPSTIQVQEGALTTYGFIHHRAGAQAARIADQILKGTPPGHIPVETAEFFLAINLHTAETIGLEVPYAFLQKADLIIRDAN